MTPVVSNPGPVPTVENPGTIVHNAAAPLTYTDLDLSTVVGANKATVMLRLKNTSGGSVTLNVREDGDTDEGGYGGTAAIGSSSQKLSNTYTVRYAVTTSPAGIIEWKSDTTGVIEIRIDSHWSKT